MRWCRWSLVWRGWTHSAYKLLEHFCQEKQKTRVVWRLRHDQNCRQDCPPAHIQILGLQFCGCPVDSSVLLAVRWPLCFLPHDIRLHGSSVPCRRQTSVSPGSAWERPDSGPVPCHGRSRRLRECVHQEQGSDENPHVFHQTKIKLDRAAGNITKTYWNIS